MACAWAASDSDAARSAWKVLNAKATALVANPWGFTSDLYLLSHSPKFATGRDA